MDDVEVSNEARVLILPPTRRDGEATSQALQRFDIACELCADPLILAQQIPAGVGAIIITDALASDPQSTAILSALDGQPAWSDAPTILMCRTDRRSAAVEELAAALTNVTVLDRPTSTRTLVSAVMAALRGRRRQYQLRDQLTALQEAQEALRIADQRKDEFLAMLAHELRNPLAPIQTASEILARTLPPQAPGRSAVDVVKRQVSHLTRLVDDLLDVSRITRGRIQLQKATVDVDSIIMQAVESVEPVIAQKKHHLTVVSRAGNVFVEGDSARLIQCVTNLLTNAVKYTAAGGEIRLEARADQSNAVISVTDNGIGIPEELMPRIFGLFVQNTRSLDRSEGGLGIGLSVVERLMEMHGGTVSVTSAGPGQGSTFTLKLPLISAPSRPSQEVVDLPITAKRLLVVDDNSDAADSIATLLRLDGHEVCVAHSGVEALQKFADFAPDVVLLDIGLPDIDGYQVAQQIRGAGGKARIVALTGYGQPADLQRGQQSGFDAHLIKPMDFASLRKAIGG